VGSTKTDYKIGHIPLTSFVCHDNDSAAWSLALRIDDLEGDQVLREDGQVRDCVLRDPGVLQHELCGHASLLTHSVRQFVACTEVSLECCQCTF
jgi:hypothetical protein